MVHRETLVLFGAAYGSVLSEMLKYSILKKNHHKKANNHFFRGREAHSEETIAEIRLARGTQEIERRISTHLPSGHLGVIFHLSPGDARSNQDSNL